MPKTGVMALADFTLELIDALDYMGGWDVFKNTVLNDYPIFNEEYRPILNDRIIQHYLFREIGYETIDQFNWGIRNEMRESAPIFNGIYRAVRDFELHPGWTTYLKTVGDAAGEGESENTARSNTDSKNTTNSTSYASQYEMPNTRLTAGEDYMSNAAKNDGESIGRTTASTDGIDASKNKNVSHSESETGGWQGVTGEILMSLSATLTSGDKEVFRILDKHFMGVWNGGQGYGPGGYSLGWPYAFGMVY